MKKYIKPEIEVVNFASESVADVEQGFTPSGGGGREDLG